METLESCPICGGQLERDVEKEDLIYKGKTITVDMVAEYCHECGEGFQNLEDQKINDRTIALAKRHVDDLLAPDDILRIRKKLGLSQREAAAIFGGGVRAFYKYERTEHNQPKSLDILLRLLDSGILSIDDIKGTAERSA